MTKRVALIDNAGNDIQYLARKLREAGHEVAIHAIDIAPEAMTDVLQKADAAIINGAYHHPEAIAPVVDRAGKTPVAILTAPLTTIPQEILDRENVTGIERDFEHMAKILAFVERAQEASKGEVTVIRNTLKPGDVEAVCERLAAAGYTVEVCDIAALENRETRLELRKKDAVVVVGDDNPLGPLGKTAIAIGDKTQIAVVSDMPLATHPIVARNATVIDASQGHHPTAILEFVAGTTQNRQQQR